VYGWALLFFWFVNCLYGGNDPQIFGIACEGLFFVVVSSLLWRFWRPSFWVVINVCLIFIIAANLYDVVQILIVGAAGLVYGVCWLTNKALRASQLCAVTSICLLFVVVSNDHRDVQTLVGVLVGSFFGMYWLGHKALRTWQGLLRDQEGSPSLLFWERIDKSLVFCIRFVVGLISLAYVATIIPAFVNGEYIFGYIVMATIAYGSLLYFVVTMFMVRDRPNRPSEFSRNRTEQAIRRARQLVLNPNDPLAEPLLLV